MEEDLGKTSSKKNSQSRESDLIWLIKQLAEAGVVLKQRASKGKGSSTADKIKHNEELIEFLQQDIKNLKTLKKQKETYAKLVNERRELGEQKD